MKIRIGENIRRLRKAKNLTQEQLAELMNVSCAAVSKWESSDTYPDITLIFPLANLFEVSVDVLMGYDASRTEADIKSRLESYHKLQYEGNYAEASVLIREARKEYPNDFQIMNSYMWDIAGGCADNESKSLNTHSNELMQICSCILNGCTDEGIRLEAMTMKAKLLHASGDTSSALEILSQFPSWYQSMGQKTEQLFAKDTPEFRYRVRRNLYELADFSADKAVKVIFFDDSMDFTEKVMKAERIGDSVANSYNETGETFLCLMAKSVYGRLSNDIIFRGGETDDIIRIRDKYLMFVRNVTEISNSDKVLHDLIRYEHNTDDLMAWTLDYYLSTNDRVLAGLRENRKYMSMLEKYRL